MDGAPLLVVHDLLRLSTPVLPAVHRSSSPPRPCFDIPHCRRHGLVRGGDAPFRPPVASYAVAAVVALDPLTSTVFPPPKCRERQFQRSPQMRHCGRAFEGTGQLDAAKALGPFRRGRHSPSRHSRSRQRATGWTWPLLPPAWRPRRHGRERAWQARMLPGRPPPSGTPAATATVGIAAAAVNLHGRPLGLAATSASHNSNSHGRHGSRATLGRHATLLRAAQPPHHRMVEPTKTMTFPDVSWPRRWWWPLLTPSPLRSCPKQYRVMFTAILPATTAPRGRLGGLMDGGRHPPESSHGTRPRQRPSRFSSLWRSVPQRHPRRPFARTCPQHQCLPRAVLQPRPRRRAIRAGQRSPRSFSDLIRDGRRRSPLPAARPQ